MAELADAVDSKSTAERLVGSTPTLGTINELRCFALVTVAGQEEHHDDEDGDEEEDAGGGPAAAPVPVDECEGCGHGLIF